MFKTRRRKRLKPFLSIFIFTDYALLISTFIFRCSHALCITYFNPTNSIGPSYNFHFTSQVKSIILWKGLHILFNTNMCVYHLQIYIERGHIICSNIIKTEFSFQNYPFFIKYWTRTKRGSFQFNLLRLKCLLIFYHKSKAHINLDVQHILLNTN